MDAIEIGALAVTVAAVAVCVLVVVVTATDAGRVMAQRLQERAEARAAHGPVSASGGDRSRDPHERAGLRERPARRRG